MFWNNKEKLGALERALSEGTRREEALTAEVAALQQALATQAAERQEKEAECDNLRAILRNLALFSQSLASSQGSLGQMANALKEERQQAVEAASVSASRCCAAGASGISGEIKAGSTGCGDGGAPRNGGGGVLV